MKTKSIILMFSLVTILFCSCNSDEQGNWSDNIQLSKKTVTFNSSANSVTITSKRNGWWLTGITLNNENVDIAGIDLTAQNFSISNQDFHIERENGKVIKISVSQNATNADRILYLSLENGDYFDSIKVTQTH